ncbi:MAG: lysophospholipid acyltransferase family protein [Woeseiaceae bacterium]|nr:lysophospholipid acyltransferase family protein [Woeseiaceae bacterium]
MERRTAGPVTALLERLWGVWALIAFGLSIAWGLLVAVLVPGRDLRGRLLTGAARAPFVLARARVEVVGLEHLPEGHAVVVANHASYVDGFLLKGYLPARFSFVIKGEVRRIPIVHFLLRRAGSRFVERFEAAGSARDARSIVRAAQGGESLAFFAEGTFRPEPGLGRFRPGAFVAAVRGGMPVVPVAISGTREMMPGGFRIPKPAPLEIRILPPILPEEPPFSDPRDLAEAARRRILAVLDEPDLLAG